MDDTRYKPFVPPDPMFDVVGKPAAPPAADKDKPKGEKPPRKRKPRPPRKRKPRPPAADKPKIPPAPKYERPTRKKKTVAKKVRLPKTRKSSAPPFGGADSSLTRAFKLDWTSAMAISALLKPADFKIFESLTETLQSVNKATRRRVLAAIGKVFG